jgi:hypothetical protein
VEADRSALDGGDGPGHTHQFASGVTGPPQHTAPAINSIVNRILGSSSWTELRRWGETLLGTGSFYIGVGVGVAKNITEMVDALLGTIKMFILAGMYEETIHPLPWWEAAISPSHLAAEAAQTLLGPNELKRAHDRCEALIKEIEQIAKHPLDFLGNAGSALAARFKRKWDVYSSLVSRTDMRSQFEAGEALGDLLTDVAMALLTVASVAGAAARIAAELPELMNVVRALRGAQEAADIAGGADAVGTAGEGEMEGTVANSAPRTSRETPPPKPKIVISDKISRQMSRRGWDQSSINNVVSNPFTTRQAFNKATGQTATAFYAQDGSYVVRDNSTAEIVQISQKGDGDWVPDSSIINPYKP